MSERRTTEILAQTEYDSATNERRVSEILAHTEYTGATNEQRVSQVLVQVEYTQPYASVELRMRNEGNTAWYHIVGAPHNLLDGDRHPDTIAANPVVGDLIYADSSRMWNRLGIGSQYQALTMGATLPAWSTYLLSGTAGGKTNFAVTNTKTLTLTATDDFNATIPASGTVALATGIAGGQTIYGGTGANDDLTLEGTSHATKTTSYVLLQPNGGNVGIGDSTPPYKLSLQNTAADTNIFLGQSATRGLLISWHYDATPSSGSAEISTYAGTNLLDIQAQLGAGQTSLNMNSGNVVIGGSGGVAKLSVFGTADAIQFRVQGFTTQAVATPMALIIRNDAAAGISAMLGLTALGSGANGDGGSVLYNGKSSTTVATAMGLDQWLWVDATHASRKARRVFNVYDTVVREAIRMEASGSAAMIGFLGANAALQQANTISDNVTLVNFGLKASGGFDINGTAGGAISGAVTSGKTLTLTATDNFNLTVLATGTAALGAGTLTSATTNDVTGSAHTHAITGSPAFLGNGTVQYQTIITGATPFVPVYSGFLLDGTTGGKTVFAVTNTKTLTLTATDDFGLTVSGNSTITGSLVGNITGSGTIATGGFTVTIPATGTPAMLTVANVFTATQTISSAAQAIYNLNSIATGSTIQQQRTNAASAIVDAEDLLGTFSWLGWDGAAFRASAQIRVNVDGTPGSSDMPGRIAFFTTPDGSATLAERMRISNLGNVGIGATSFGTSAAIVVAVKTGTAPSTSPADMFQMYSADITAGNAAAHFRTEGGTVIKLYQPTTYTQTYAVATATHASPTAATLTDSSGGTADTTLAAVEAAYTQATIRNNFADLAAMVNKNTADHLALAKFVNQIADDLQVLGLAG